MAEWVTPDAPFLRNRPERADGYVMPESMITGIRRFEARC